MTVEWQFGGWFRSLPPPVAGAVFGALFIVGLALIVWLYRHTLRELSPGRRAGLIAFRAAILLTVLLCLANPARVERDRRQEGPHDTLAVVVDRSDSMTGADFRGTTRLAGAARLWRAHESEARAAYPKVVYERFAVGVSPARDLDDALTAPGPGPETHLYAALRQTLDTRPGAVVCLTDGLDTTEETADELAGAAQRQGVPLYFVLGANRARPRGDDTLDIREVKSPSSVLRQTQFTARVLIETASARAGELPVELWSGDVRLAAARLPLRAGLNTLPWPVPVTAGEAGAMALEFRVGEGAARQVAACVTQVVERAKVGVLYYQGALQWGYHFLRTALESDPSFELTSILNPALSVRINAGTAEGSVLADLPADARELRRFQIVVLAHVFAAQLPAAQQQALVEYARGGGGVLFIAPDSSAAQSFTGTALEQMLPVVFAPAAAQEKQDEIAAGFREEMLASAGEGADETSENLSLRRQVLPRLQPFAPPPGADGSAAVRKLFESADPASLPKFLAFAQVRRVKPGAQVLAVGWPRPGAAPEVLLARQQFGEGFAAALTTDLLWRWKMKLPSNSHAVERFWQQLLLSLTPGAGTGLRVTKLTAAPARNVPVTFRVDAAAGAAPTAEAVSPQGETQRLAVAAADEAAGGWRTGFTPASPGRWEVRATDAARNVARLTFRVPEQPRTTESLNLPPDVEGLRRLAESTGGALIEEAPVFQPTARTDEPARVRRVQPVWDSSWLLALLLGLYGAELILRRCFRLL